MCVKSHNIDSTVLGRNGQLGEENTANAGERFRGGQGDVVRNQRREQHKQKQHRLLNSSQRLAGELYSDCISCILEN